MDNGLFRRVQAYWVRLTNMQNEKVNCQQILEHKFVIKQAIEESLICTAKNDSCKDEVSENNYSFIIDLYKH